MVYPTEPDDEGWQMMAESGPGAVRPEPTGPAPADTPPDEAELARELQLAFAPIHKRAFGTATGTALGLLIAGLTLFHVVLGPESNYPLELLDQYFYGYTVSLGGVLVGGFWGFIVGFVGGWFVAFCRNLAIAVSVFVTRTRAELAETRDFLDHI